MSNGVTLNDGQKEIFDRAGITKSRRVQFAERMRREGADDEEIQSMFNAHSRNLGFKGEMPVYVRPEPVADDFDGDMPDYDAPIEPAVSERQRQLHDQWKNNNFRLPDNLSEEQRAEFKSAIGAVKSEESGGLSPQEQIKKRIQDNKQAAGMPDATDEEFQEYLNAKGEREFKEKLQADPELQAMTFLANMGNAGSFGLAGFLLGDEGKAALKESRELFPGTAIAGQLTGSIVGAPGMAYRAATKTGFAAKEAMIAAGWSPKAAWAARIGTDAALSSMAFQGQQMVERAAGTREWADTATVIGDTLGDTAASAVMNIMFSGMGGIVGPWFSKTGPAIDKMGGPKVVRAAEKARQDVLKAGGSLDDGAAAYFAAMTKNMKDSEANEFVKMMKNDEHFRKLFADQAVAGKATIDNGLDLASKRQLSKVTGQAVDTIKRGQKLGATDGTDLTENAVRRLLGTADGDTRFLQIQDAAQQNARSIAAGDASVAEGIKRTTAKLGQDVAVKGDVDGVRKIIAGADFNDFKSLNDDMIMAYVKQMAGEGVNVTPQQAARELAKQKAEYIFMNGTANPQDVFDMKELTKKLPDVRSGRGTPIGAYREGLNRQVLENPQIFGNEVAGQFTGIHNMKRLEDVITEGHRVGSKASSSTAKEIQSFLDPTNLVPDELLARQTGVQMGFLNTLKETMASGDARAVNELMHQTKQNPALRDVFAAKGVNEWVKEMMPEITAMKRMNMMVRASNSIDDSNMRETLSQVGKVGVSAASNAPIALMSNLDRLAKRVTFSRGTQNKIAELVAGTQDGTFSWAKFNKMLDGVTDLTEKRQLERAMRQAIAITTQDVAERDRAEQGGW